MQNGPAQEDTPLRALPQWQQLLVDTFTHIQHTRMRGVPVINTQLAVNADCFVRWQDYFLGVLITPWFMNLMLLPAGEESAGQMQQQRIGEKQTHVFPSGPYEFIVGAEAGLGRYQSCSLFSPMFDFCDRAAAEETAAAILRELMKMENLEVLDSGRDETPNTTGEVNGAAPMSDSDGNQQSLLEKPFSRRQLFTELRR